MKRKLNILFASAFFFVIIVSYQNCGTSQQGSLFDAQSYSQLPYEFSTNQLAYLSCSEQGNVANDHGVFFTFRGGAYNDASGNAVAGLRLTEDFLYDTRRQSNFKRMDILFEDRGTSLSRLQFAVRRESNLAGMFVNSDSGGATEEMDFDYVFGDFGSDEMSASLLTAPTGQYMNYWSPAGVNKDAYFEGSLVFNSSETLAQQTRQFFSTGGILAWAFAETNKPESIRSIDFYDNDDDPDTEEPIVTNRALGLGYRVVFKQPLASNWYTVGSTHSNVPKRVLQSVSEFDLNSKVSSPSWTCPTDLQLRVVFPDDIWNVGSPKDPSVASNFLNTPLNTTTYPTQAGQTAKLCRQAEDTDALNSGNVVLERNLAIVRRSLPISDWYVNLTDRCIIPKRYTLGSCYGIDSGTGFTRNAAYNPTGACNPAVSASGLNVCAHYFSVCYKN